MASATDGPTDKDQAAPNTISINVTTSECCGGEEADPHAVHGLETDDQAFILSGKSADSEGELLPAGSTTRGEVWRVEVTPDDGRVSGPAASAELTIQNSLPAVETPVITPNAAFLSIRGSLP